MKINRFTALGGAILLNFLSIYFTYASGILDQVEELKRRGDFKQAFELALREMTAIRKRTKVGGVVDTVFTDGKKIWQQIVTRTTSNYISDSGVFVEPGGIVSPYTLAHSSTKRWRYRGKTWSVDETKWVLTHPENFDLETKVEIDDEKLRQNLLRYIETHIEDLILLKGLAIHALHSAYEGRKTGQVLLRVEEINTIAKVAADIRFIGDRPVTYCVERHFADLSQGKAIYSSSSSVESFIPLLGSLPFIIEIPILNSMVEGSSGRSFEKRESKQIAHVESQCQSSFRKITVYPQDSIFSIDLRHLDLLLEDWTDTLTITSYFQKMKSTPKPTFGSPLLKN